MQHNAQTVKTTGRKHPSRRGGKSGAMRHHRSTQPRRRTGHHTRG